MTDVTIRGIDDDVYARFAAEAKKRGVPIGELTTMVMRALIEEAVAPSYRIGNIPILQVTKKDLESLDGTVSFYNIKRLEFADDVDWPVFKSHVESIESISLVVAPQGLTRFQVLTRCKSVSEVVQKK